MIWWVCMCQLNLLLHRPYQLFGAHWLATAQCAAGFGEGEVRNSRGIWMKRKCLSEENITYMCFLGWTMPDVACKNIDTRIWSDLGWWYGWRPVLKKQQTHRGGLQQFYNNSVQSLQKANSLWQTETGEMDLDGAGELLVTWPKIHMPCSWCKSWKQQKKFEGHQTLISQRAMKYNPDVFFCCMVVESDLPRFTMICRHTHICVVLIGW